MTSCHITLELTFRIDDPYYYLYYGRSPRSASYFTLELQEPQVGRVLRFDSMSKILSAGIRIGFASGPEAILTAMDRHVRRLVSSQRRILISPRSDATFYIRSLSRLAKSVISVCLGCSGHCGYVVPSVPCCAGWSSRHLLRTCKHLR